MRISDLLGSVHGRVLTIYERSSGYVYWKRAFVAILIGGILIAGVWYALFRVRGWVVPAGLLAVVGVVAAVYRRKRFLSPSSIRLQTRLFLAIQHFRRVRKRDTWQMMRDAVESRPFTGAVAAPVFCLGAFPIVTANITRFLQSYSIASGVDETIWVVHATVTGFSFIVLIFFWEFLGDEFDNAVFIRTAVRYTWSLHIIYFLLAANVVIGVLAVLAQGQQVTSYVGVQAVLFILSMFGVYWLYDTVYTVMVKETLASRIKRRLDQQIGAILTEPDQDGWVAVVNRQLDHGYPQLALPDFSGGQERMTARDLGLSGEVTDIHLHRLHDLFDEASALDVDIERLPALGQSYHGDDDVFVYQGDLTAQEEEWLRTGLRRAIKMI
jgi:hypothetical protein